MSQLVLKQKRSNAGHLSRDIDELSLAKNRIKLKKSVFNTKKEFREIFNDFMAPRQHEREYGSGSSALTLHKNAINSKNVDLMSSVTTL